MLLAEINTDIQLEIIACLPLGAIARVVQVHAAWKELVDANESNIYHDAAMLHRFVLSANTTLVDAVSSLDFDTSALSIGGWKDFVSKLRLGIERNWTGSGLSKMGNIGAIGGEIHQRKSILNSEYTISASFLNIAVHGSNGIVWALPDDYLQRVPYFAYDAGYLALPNQVLNTIEIWREPSVQILPSGPSSAQKLAAQASAELYGAPAAGHFVPCYTLPSKGEAPIKEACTKMIYPTLLSATPGDIHMWDISTGQHLRTLRTTGILEKHAMNDFIGIDMSKDHVLAFDSNHVRLFSRDEGHFLFHFSRSTAFSRAAVALQLLPPRHAPSSVQCDNAALLRQVVFPRSKEWKDVRGELMEVLSIALSPCGTTLVATRWNRRLLIIHDLPRMISGELSAQETAVDIQIGEEYYNPIAASPAVTLDRIAVGTELGIIVLTLDRSGSASTGSARLGMPTGLSSPIRLSASFLHLGLASKLRNITICGTKLAFDGSATMRPGKTFLRRPRKRSDPARLPGVTAPRVNTTFVPDIVAPHANQDFTEDSPDDDGASDDSMPDLQSVSNSRDSENTDEESLCFRGMAISDWNSDSEDSDAERIPPTLPVTATIFGVPAGGVPVMGNMDGHLDGMAAFFIDMASQT
ncbi:hypothetical protein K438DRAFT_1982267 [Mycena galopus ATCC 62051]|nr:hypothetical protein K438DRAFT_1982267 [Mycena galopus ATCC 62051]